MASHRCSLHCVVPPYMLKELLKHNDSDIRDRAFRSLTITADYRGFRRAAGAMATYMAAGPGGLNRTIYDGEHATKLPGTLIGREREIEGKKDGAALRAYNGLGDTYNFYKQAFNRNSIDNRGMRLDATVHYGDRFDNAFWNGSQMVFGDGDGVIFNDFTTCLDVIGHELTHGVTQVECNLTYYGESGALNESMSDVFGVLIKQYAADQLGKRYSWSDPKAWLIGDGLLVRGGALRSMNDPGSAYKNDPDLGTDPQPADKNGYINTEDDNGGVHLNSGIPNHAFYLAAKKIGGNPWDDAGKIWYAALPTFTTSCTFQQAAELTYRAAGGLFGKSSTQADAVADAWADVGYPVSGRAVAPPTPVPADGTDLAADNFDKLVDRLCDVVTERFFARLESKLAPATTKKKK